MAWLSSRYSNNVAINLGGFYIVSVEFHGVGIFKRKIQYYGILTAVRVNQEKSDLDISKTL